MCYGVDALRLTNRDDLYTMKSVVSCERLKMKFCFLKLRCTVMRRILKIRRMLFRVISVGYDVMTVNLADGSSNPPHDALYWSCTRDVVCTKSSDWPLMCDVIATNGLTDKSTVGTSA